MFFAPVALLLLWPLQFAFAIEDWRQSSGPAVARWLAAVGELEALGSLAGYSYEHPHDPFPELVDGGGCFEGEGLGHPLIPEARNVRTDLRLSDEPSRVDCQRLEYVRQEHAVAHCGNQYRTGFGWRAGARAPFAALAASGWSLDSYSGFTPGRSLALLR